jgi:hypothetical protein
MPRIISYGPHSVLSSSNRHHFLGQLPTENETLPPDYFAGSRMPQDEFTTAEMQTIMLAHTRVCAALNLTDEKHFALKTRICGLLMECAEAGERDLQKLIDCAYARLNKESSAGGPAGLQRPSAAAGGGVR